MDYKKSKAPVNTVTRNIMDLCRDTENIYESVAIISKPFRLRTTSARNWLSLHLITIRSKKCLRIVNR